MRRNEMTVSNWNESDTERARAFWSEYTQHHDISGKTGQTVGIDPNTGRIWFGDSIQDVIAQRDADGISAPLYAIRVGYDYYYRKGSKRRSTASFRMSGFHQSTSSSMTVAGGLSLTLVSTDNWNCPNSFDCV